MSISDILKSSTFLALMLGLLGWTLWQQKQAGRLVLALDRNWLITLLAGLVTAMFIYSSIRDPADKIAIVAIVVWCMNWILMFLGSRLEM